MLSRRKKKKIEMSEKEMKRTSPIYIIYIGHIYMLPTGFIMWGNVFSSSDNLELVTHESHVSSTARGSKLRKLLVSFIWVLLRHPFLPYCKSLMFSLY